jgi:hypothetical protein
MFGTWGESFMARQASTSTCTRHCLSGPIGKLVAHANFCDPAQTPCPSAFVLVRACRVAHYLSLTGDGRM